MKIGRWDIIMGTDGCKNNTCSYDEAVELTGHGRYNYLLLAACCIIMNAVSMDMFGFSVAVTAASCDLQLGLREIGVLVSAPFAGVLFAYPWGYYADTRGRKRALVLSTSVSFFFAAATSLATNWQFMFVAKLLACSCSSAGFTLTITLLGECTGEKHRSQYLFILNSINLTAELVYFALAYFILPLPFNIPLPWVSLTLRPWRLFAFVLALPLGFGALMMFFIYESPKFLANRGDNTKALKVLRKIYERNGGMQGSYPCIAVTVANKLGIVLVVTWSRSQYTGVKTARVTHVENIVTSGDSVTTKLSLWESLVKQTVPIFKPPLLWRTLQLFYLLALLCSTNNVFAVLFPTMVNQYFISFSNKLSTNKSFCERLFSGNNVFSTDENYVCNDIVSTNTIYAGMAYGLFFGVLTMTTSTLAARRRLVLITILLVSAVSCCLVNLKEPISNMVFFVLLQSTGIGIGSVASYFVDLYPTAYRGLATGLAVMVARQMSFISVNIVTAVIANNCSTTFYGWSVFVFSGIIVTLFLPSDKKGNT